MTEVKIPDDVPKVVDNSFCSSVQRCLRYAYYRHVLHLVPVINAPALSFGLAFHHGIHLWYEGEKTRAAEVEALNWIEENYDPPEGEKRTKWLAFNRLKEYFDRYQNEPFECLHSEVGFAIPLTSDIMYGGRIDRVIRWEDGRLYGKDTKTASGLGLYWLNQFNPHHGITGYCWGISQLFGEFCHGMLIDGVNTAENPKEVFLRDITNRNEGDIKDFKYTVIETCDRWRLCLKWLRNGRNPLDVFYQETVTCGMYTGCAYRQLCLSHAAQSVIDSQFKVEPWVPYEIEGNNENAKI